MFPNLPLPTVGGKVFWDTLEEKHGWKFQQNMITEHYRILDYENIRQAWGSDYKVMKITFKKFTRDIES